MDKEAMRKAFEEWYEPDADNRMALAKYRTDYGYDARHPYLNGCWNGWQAAIAHSCADKEAIAEALRRVLRSFPTDGDMQEAGWEPCEIEEACLAHEHACATLSRQGEGD